MNNIILFHKLPMLNNTDSAFEMLLRVIASYNDKDLAEFVLSDILDSLQENYMKLLDTDITHEELVQLCDIYFSICLNIANTEEVFRDINFYKEILDELIKNYDPIFSTAENSINKVYESMLLDSEYPDITFQEKKMKLLLIYINSI